MSRETWETWTLTCRSEEEAEALMRLLMSAAGYVGQEGLAVRVYARVSTIQAALTQFGLAVTVPYQEGQAGPPLGERDR